MSLSPSSPQGAPTLAEVLLQRTFAKPPEPFVDGDLTQALSRADAGEVPGAVEPAAKQDGAGTSSQDEASHQSSAGSEPGRTIDVRV